jgi:hypothetical protein
MSLIKLYLNTFRYKKYTSASKNEYIYAISNPITKLTKIGITYNLEQRINALSSSSGCNLFFINYNIRYNEIDESAKYVESFLHEVFNEFRIKGEWFNLNDLQVKRLSTFIESLD